MDKAIASGVEFLKTAPSIGAHREIANCDGLVFLTLITAGLPETDPGFQSYLARILECKLERTYHGRSAVRRCAW